jgi:high-affinity Fe2+/Pb2+ permease
VNKGGIVVYNVFVRLMGLLGAIYFGLFGYATWHYIATQPCNWKNYMAAIICNVMTFMGLWLLIHGPAKEE